jgi:hypothetical protein
VKWVRELDPDDYAILLELLKPAPGATHSEPDSDE